MPTVTRRRARNWSVQRITRALHEKGVTHQSLADELGKGRSTVSEVVSGRLKSAAVADAIAAVLGTTRFVIWPRVYGPDPTLLAKAI